MKKNKLFIIVKGIKVLTILFLLVLLFVVLIQKIGNNKYSVGGYRIFMIASESMAPKYEVGDILVSKVVDPTTIQIGDDVTYLGNAGDFNHLVVTHQVIEKRQENNQYYFQTKGLANTVADPEINEDQIYGKVVYKTVVFSLLGHLLQNNIVYYILFVLVGISLSYEIICHIKELKDEEKETENKD